jgi:hypothetical protein
MESFMGRRFAWALVFLAIVIGAATALPQLFAIHAAGGEFAGIYPLVNDDQRYYEARMNKSARGDTFLSNAYIADYRGESTSPQWFSDWALSRPSAVLGGSVQAWAIFFDFLLPAIIVLLAGCIAYLVTGSAVLSFTSVLIFSGYFFFGAFNRSPSPQFNILCVLGFILAMLLFLRSARLRYLGLAFLSLAVSFYAYPYYWTYLFLVLGLFTLYLMYARAWRLARATLAISLAASIVAIPYFYAWWQNMALPSYAESAERVGLVESHVPGGFLILGFSLPVLFAFFIAYRARIVRLDTETVFLALLNVAAVMAVEQHVVTGMELEFSSHYYVPAVFAALLLTFFLVARILERTNAKRNILTVVFFSLAGILAIGNITDAVLRQSSPSEVFLAEQRYGPLLSWIAASAGEDVFWAAPSISSLIAAYTGAYVAYAPEANFFLMPQEEVYERFAFQRYFEEPLTEDIARAYERDLWRVKYINRRAQGRLIRGVFGIPQSGGIPPDAIKDAIRADKRVRARGFLENAELFGVAYVVVDKHSDTLSAHAVLETLDPIWEDKNMLVLRVP